MSDSENRPCESSPEGLSVYVVDDEPDILAIVARGLENAGFNTKVFGKGQAFEHAVMRDRPDICVVDLSLPDHNGIVILQELARLQYRGRILLISGYGHSLLDSVRRLATDHKLDIIGSVRKPFTVKMLLDALQGEPSRDTQPARQQGL